MVTAIVQISKRSNRALNIIKAKHNLKTKSEAIERLVEEYENLLPEPELRPEYVKKLVKIVNGPHEYVGIR